MAFRMSLIMLVAATHHLIAEEFDIKVPTSCQSETYCTEKALSGSQNEKMKELLRNLTKPGDRTVPWPPGPEPERSEGQDDCRIVGGKGSYETLRYVRFGDLQGDPWFALAHGEGYEQRVYIERCEGENYEQPCFQGFSVGDNRKARCVQQKTAINLKVLKGDVLVTHNYLLPTYCACMLVPDDEEYYVD